LQMKGEAVSGRPVDVSILPAGVYMVETNDRSGGIEFTKVLKNN
jgi:glucose/arabinose dehydrogenase